MLWDQICRPGTSTAFHCCRLSVTFTLTRNTWKLNNNGCHSYPTHLRSGRLLLDWSADVFSEDSAGTTLTRNTWKVNYTGFHSYPKHLRKVAFLRPNLKSHPSEVGQNALGPNLPTAHIDRVFRVHRGGSAVVKTCFPPLFPANSTITRLGSVCTLFTFGRLPATFGRVRAAFHYGSQCSKPLEHWIIPVSTVTRNTWGVVGCDVKSPITE